jgi:hypothetical protein
MTDDLEQRMRRELTGSRYELGLDPDDVLARVSGPKRRPRPAAATLATAAAALAVAAAVTVGFLLPGTSEAPVSPPAASASPAATLNGLPPDLAPAGDVAEVIKRAPALVGLPPGGARSAYAAAADGGVWRVVMVVDGGVAGLPGSVLDVPSGWAPDGSQLLLTRDGETTYVKVYRPDGRNFCLAVTGGPVEEQLAVLKRLVTTNVTR